MTRPSPALTLIALLTACDGGVEGAADGLAIGGAPRIDRLAPTVRNLAVADTTALQDGRKVSTARDVVISADVTDVNGIAGVCVGEGLKACADFTPWQGQVEVELSPGEGQKAIQLWFKDGRGNVSPRPHMVRIWLDRFGPEDGEAEATLRPGVVELDWWGFEDEGVGVVGYIVAQEEGRIPTSCADGEVIYAGGRTGMRVTDLTMDQRYGWRVCGVDAVGHISTGVVVEAVPYPELFAPEVTAFAPVDGALDRTARLVDLQIAAEDESGVAAMCLSTSAPCADWTSFAETTRFVLPDVDGDHTVYLWLEDAYGNRTRNPARLDLTLTRPVDADGDGADSTVDCDDSNAEIRPGALEVCNRIDDDCNGLADDDDAGLLLSSGLIFYTDADGDGWGSPTTPERACAMQPGQVSNSSDCDDADADIRPGAPEACDGGDNNCDGNVDEDQAMASEALFFTGDAGVSGDGYVVGGSTWGAAHLPLALGEEREQLVLSLARPTGATFALAFAERGTGTGPAALAGEGQGLRLRVDDAGVTVVGVEGDALSVADGDLPPAMGPRSLLVLLEPDRAHIYVDGMPIAEDLMISAGQEFVLAGEGGAVELPSALWTCAL